MTPADFTAARKSLGLTQAGLAAALDVSKRTVEALEAGTVAKPRVYWLAMQALTPRNDESPARG